MAIQSDGSSLGYLFNIISGLLPFLLNMGALVYLIYLLSSYKNVIAEGHTSSQFYQFNTISKSIILMQMFIILSGLRTKQYLEEKILPFTYKSGSTLLAVLHLSLVVTMGFILESFTTDG